MPLSFDPEFCIACDECVDVCQVDIMIPNPEAGLPPLVVFPGECWYDGSCVDACPVPGAISLNRMGRNIVHCRRRETGQDFYI
jgi:NAD-dependent dihydropyrimidine dehydrogenase PreA subunit